MAMQYNDWNGALVNGWYQDKTAGTYEQQVRLYQFQPWSLLKETKNRRGQREVRHARILLGVDIGGACRAQLPQRKQYEKFTTKHRVCGVRIVHDMFKAFLHGIPMDDIEATADVLDRCLEEKVGTKGRGPILSNLGERHELRIRRVVDPQQMRRLRTLRVGDGLAEARGKGGVGGLADQYGRMEDVAMVDEPRRAVARRVDVGLPCRGRRTARLGFALPGRRALLVLGVDGFSPLEALNLSEKAIDVPMRVRIRSWSMTNLITSAAGKPRDDSATAVGAHLCGTLMVLLRFG
jgi:hypothetical protein